MADDELAGYLVGQVHPDDSARGVGVRDGLDERHRTAHHPRMVPSRGLSLPFQRDAVLIAVGSPGDGVEGADGVNQFSDAHHSA